MVGIVFIIVFAIGIVIFCSLFNYYSQFEFEAKNIKFTNEWLNFTIYFKKLPEEGAKFTSITINGFQEELPDETYYTNDSLRICVYHQGKIKEIPEKAVLWMTEVGFEIKLKR